MLLDKQVLVEILAEDQVGGDKEGWVTHSGFFGTASGLRTPYVRMNIQPASPELTAMAEGEMFKTFTAFTKASGVVEGMRVTVSGTSERYVVRGRQKFDYGVEEHYELVLAKGGIP